MSLLKVKVPASLREFYLIAGREGRINQKYNRLLPPAKWLIDDRRLIFMEENQRTVFWAVAACNRASTDAVVFQGVNHKSEGIEWFVEHERCSEFLNVMAVWNATYGGAAAFCAVGYVDEVKTRETLDANFQFLGEVNEMRAYKNGAGVVSFLKWEDRFQQLRKLPPWRVFIGGADAERRTSVKNSLPAQWEDWGD
jgi:hypothetical protein